jgi:hypothetical protein
VPALDTVLSLDGGDLTTSGCHLWGIRIDTPALVVHASTDPVCEVLPRRKMYWFGRARAGTSPRAIELATEIRVVDAITWKDEVSRDRIPEYGVDQYRCPLMSSIIQTLGNNPAATNSDKLIKRLLNTTFAARPPRRRSRRSVLHHSSIHRP